jgi:hypothetical protein
LQVFDATNSTRHRRELLLHEISRHGASVFFVESVCDDDDQIHRNILVRWPGRFAGNRQA